VSDTLVPERPLQEKYQTLSSQRQLAASRLSEAELLLALDDVKPDGLGQSLLGFITKDLKPAQAPKRHALERDVLGWSAALEFLDAEIQAWEEQQDAYFDATMPKPEVVVPEGEA